MYLKYINLRYSEHIKLIIGIRA